MGLQVARFTQEATYNTFPATPAAGTQLDIFLPASNAMTVLPMPEFWEVRDAGVSNRLVERGVGRVNVGGQFTTFAFPSQIAYMANLAAGLTGTAPCLDLPSFTIDRGVYLEGGSCARGDRRYTGCKIGNFVLSADQSTQGSLFTIKASVVGSTPVSITDAQLPIQTLSAYPADNPYLFYQTAGKLTVDTVRTNYQNVTLTIGNVLKSFPDENVYIQNLGWKGRTVTLSAKLLYKSLADRLSFESGSKHAVSLAIDNGVTAVTISLGTNAQISDVADDMPIDDYFTYDLTMTAIIDGTLSTPTDLVITAAAG